MISVTQPYPGTEIYRNLGRPIAREEYHQLSRVLPPEKFRLSSHRQDLHKLLFLWQLRYGIIAPVEISYFRADWRYWSHLRHSPLWQMESGPPVVKQAAKRGCSSRIGRGRETTEAEGLELGTPGLGRPNPLGPARGLHGCLNRCENSMQKKMIPI